MPDRNLRRGLPVPALGTIAVVTAALIGAWAVWSKQGPSDGSGPVAGAGPLRTIQLVEALVKQGKAALPELTAMLDSEDPKERQVALIGLARLGPQAAGALGKIREQLADDDPRVRNYAVFAVTHVDENPEEAAAAIAPLLADFDSAVRESVSSELSRIGPGALAALCGMLHGGPVAGRLEAIGFLRTRRDAPWYRTEAEIAEAIRGATTDVDPAVRIEAVTLAAERRLANPAQVRALLHDADQSRVTIALDAVPSLEADAAKLLPDVLGLLDERTAFESPPMGVAHHVLRLQSVLNALSSMKAGARPAIGRLVAMCKGKRHYSCTMIARTLCAIGADEEKVAGILTPLVLCDDRRLVHEAGEWLARLCPAAARHQVSLLLPKLGSDATAVDKRVLYAICSLGAQAQEAVSAIVPLLKSDDPSVILFAAYTLHAAGPSAMEGAPALAEAVCNRSLPIAPRQACAGALGNIGPQARTAVPVLLVVLAERASVETHEKTGAPPEMDLHERIIDALGRIGGNDDGLLPTLQAELSSRSPRVRVAAVVALGRIGKQSPDLVSDLLRLLHDDDPPAREMAAVMRGYNPQVRQMSALAIGRLDGDLSSAVTPLGDALFDNDQSVATAAAISLGKIGRAARPVLPALRQILADQRHLWPQVPVSTAGYPQGGRFYYFLPEFFPSVTFEQAVEDAIAAIEAAAGSENE